MYNRTTHPSLLGTLTLACDGEGQNLVGLWIQGQKYHGDTLPLAMEKRDDIPLFDDAKNWLDRYFSGQRPGVSELPLAPVGGAFRQEVWSILCEIPYGDLMTYGDIARKMAVRMGRAGMSSRAVGQAVGHNPLSIVIPCHRVVGSNGSLTGFSAGLEAKMKLLRLEGVDPSRFLAPAKGRAL